jgi:hypothetical protein
MYFFILQTLQLRGSKLKEVEKFIKKYDNIDIEIDSLDSNDDSIYIYIFNLNRILTCSIFIIDNEEQKTFIRDLRTDSTCVKDNQKIMKYIINIIKEISINAKMKSIQLTDNSFHVCKNTNYSFKLDIANTLTNGYPYYYKYGFIYLDDNVHKSVKKNNKKLKSYLTSKLDINKINLLIEKKLKNIDIIEKDIDTQKTIVLSIYNKYKDENIMKFLYNLKYDKCVIFSLIHMDIYLSLGLLNYSSNIMIFNL